MSDMSKPRFLVHPRAALRRTLLPSLLFVAGLMLVIAQALAQTSGGGPFENERRVIGGGGGTSAGGDFAVSGTVGQPLARRSEQGRFVVESGYWPAAPSVSDLLFVDGFEE